MSLPLRVECDSTDMSFPPGISTNYECIDAAIDRARVFAQQVGWPGSIRQVRVIVEDIEVARFNGILALGDSEDEHRAQVRARGRAMRRLAGLYPELYAALVEEEDAIFKLRTQ